MQVGERQVGGDATTGRALDKTFLDEERLIHFLDGAGILVESCCKSRQSHRAATKLVDDGGEQLVVNLIETISVDIKSLEGISGYVGVDLAVAFHLGEVAHAAQQ